MANCERTELEEPLLPEESGSFFKNAARSLLLFSMWLAFAIWVLAWILFPTQYVGVAFRLGTLLSLDFGGSILLFFAAPIFIISILAFIYLQLPPKKGTFNYSRPRVSLWTYPVFVDGWMGVVSAGELLFVLMFLAYLLWSIANYAYRGLTEKAEGDHTHEKIWQLGLDLVGLRLGALGLMCVSLLFLPVARGSVLLRLIDIPFEHAVKYHVWLGHLTMALFTLHGLSYIILWTSEGHLLNELLSWQKIGIANLPGVIALLAGLAIWVTSFGLVRQNWFEMFFYTHQLYLVFVVFMALHVGDFVFGLCFSGIFLFAIDRFLRFLQSRRAASVLSSRVLPCGTIELVLPKTPDLSYNSLSFVFLNIRSISWLQWHPFSVSSSPLDSQNSISFLIKPLGSWTHRLSDIIRTSEPRADGRCPLWGKVFVEGPYGHESDYFLKYKVLVLVAGGIGVAPFVAIIKDILHRHNLGHKNLPEHVILIWAVKTSKELNVIEIVSPSTICKNFDSKLNLDIRVYVTRESGLDLEIAGDKNLENSLKQEPFSDNIASQKPISTLVGTSSNMWMGLYTAACILGFAVFWRLTSIYYIEPIDHGTYFVMAWWLRSTLLVLVAMLAIILCGGAVTIFWSWIGYPGKRSSRNEVDAQTLSRKTTAGQLLDDGLVKPDCISYGARPDFKNIFEGLTKQFSGSNVGVLVCGPTSIQTAVASQCRLHNSMNLRLRTIAFHYHSVSFDL